MAKKLTKIAAIADTHIKESSQGEFRGLFEEISKIADVLVLGGDLTDHGFSVEATVLVEELSVCDIPVLGVLGNHDYTNNEEKALRQILRKKVAILDEEPVEINGVGFAGVKGFAGGFENHMLGAFGEEVLKSFVFEAINQALRLEELLGKLETDKKVVVLHYSPIKQTVVGEAVEIYSFLGSSHLEEPINSYDCKAVIHGHAHHGTHQGKTLKGIPVYNVALPLLKKKNEEQPFLLIEI